MSYFSRWVWALLFIIVGCASEALAQEAQSKLLIVYDSSNSMWGELSDQSRKYEAGRSALSDFLQSNFDKRLVGLRAYGHRDPTDCRDSELLVPFGSSESVRDGINREVSLLRPTGKTPITHSLREAMSDFDDGPGDILLISDGVETCDADPCELVGQWQSDQVDIRVHVVGVGLRGIEKTAMSCIADVSGGRYFDAESQAGFADALKEASQEIVAPTVPVESIPDVQDYRLILVAADADGRSYFSEGKLYQNGKEVGAVSTGKRNLLPAAGDYRVEVGPVLQDGSIYQPVSASFSIDEPGEVRVPIVVVKPALVSARFAEDGESHRGASVFAFQNDREVFNFRSFDEVLAAPGLYRFQSAPNADNDLLLEAELRAGEHTELAFQLAKTLEFYLEFQLPNGETFKRSAELWKDGEKVYDVHSNNGGLAKPGVYEVRSDDQNLPITPTQIEISELGQTIEVQAAAGFVEIDYAPPLENYIGAELPNRVFIESIDRGGRSFNSPSELIALAPGKYRILPFDRAGFFDTQEIQVDANETQRLSIVPKPVGEVVVSYDSDDPSLDRASIEPLDGQRIISNFMRVGQTAKFLPGRYRVTPSNRAQGIDPTEIEVQAGQVTNVTFE